MCKRAVSLWVAAVVSVSLPDVAHAQGPTANDPDADSPSGAVYRIPLEGARADAAPGAAGADSPIRSENGFGSSSAVPGASTGDTAASAPAPGDDSTRGRASGDDSAGGSASRDDSTRGPASDGETAAVANSTRPVATQAAAEPSVTRSYLLLALAPIVAVVLGAVARRR